MWLKKKKKNISTEIRYNVTYADQIFNFMQKRSDCRNLQKNGKILHFAATKYFGKRIGPSFPFSEILIESLGTHF